MTLCVLLQLAFASFAADRPNIIFFIADDMRPHHFNCLPEGKDKNLTPNIDRLAAEGTLLRNMHVVSPLCTPSRFSCLTGKYPSRSRNPWFIERAEQEGQPVVEFNTYIIDGDDTLPRRLQKAGYATGFAGKNHVIAADGLEAFPDFDASAKDPENAAKLERNYQRVRDAVLNAGFDEAGGIYHNNPDFIGLGEVAVQNMDWITQAGVDFIEKRHGEPLFLYFATTVPHAPSEAGRSWNADPRITARGYLDEAPDVLPPRDSIPERLKESGLPVNNDTANILWLDDALGALMKKLEDVNELDNTIIFFFNDHGQNAKGTLYQGGVHDPCLVWMQGGFACGSQLDALLSNVDFAPTILDMAGVDFRDAAYDGQTFMPQLNGAPAVPDRVLYFELGYAAAIRKGKWKYLTLNYPEAVKNMSMEERSRILNEWNTERRRKHLPLVTEDPLAPFSHLSAIPGGGHAEIESTGSYPAYYDSIQLYDLSSDPGELVNLAESPACAQVVKNMQSIINQIDAFKRTGDKMPDGKGVNFGK